MADAAANTEWKVGGHGPIEKLAENLWRVEGDLPGMPLKRVMTVARRSGGGLVVHNAIALDDASMKELDALGDVAEIIVPNGYHRLDAPRFKARYPKAKVFAPAGATKKVSDVVPVDGSYDDLAREAGPDREVAFAHLDGTREGEGVMTVRSKDGVTLVFNDAIFNMPHVPGFQGFVLKSLTKSTGGPRVSRIGKLFLVKDKAAFKAGLAVLADTPGLRRVVVSHHEMITSDCGDAIRAAAATV
ncbi:MAG: hypothetical protein U0414_25650 [Polyangiaceae bacterium]